MNALNRFGWVICPLCMFFLMEVVGKNYIDGYKLITIRYGDNFFEMVPLFVFIPVLFDLVFSELRFDRFYYFYPESFFDRNWYVIIQTAIVSYLFKENWQIVVSIAVFVLVVNDLFRRWRTKKQMIVIENLKKVSAYPDFDVTKFKFKNYQKNFFLRSWFMLVIPWSLIIVTNSMIRSFLMFPMVFSFLVFEIFNLNNASKEIGKFVNTEDII